MDTAVARRTRRALLVAALGVGVAAGIAAPHATDAGALAVAVVAFGATALTAVAANWSTCGLSVVSVIAAPKGVGRPGLSTPVTRLWYHALGSLPVAAGTGALVGAAGGLLPSRLPAGLLLGLLAVAYGLHELGFVRMPTPMRRRQLPRHWRRSMSPRRVSFLFGVIIGPGFLIFIRSSAYYVMVASALLVGSPAVGVAMFVAVALGRCAPGLTAILYQRRGGTMPGFLELSLRIDRRVQLGTGIGLAALGGACLAIVATGVAA